MEILMHANDTNFYTADNCRETIVLFWISSRLWLTSSPSVLFWPSLFCLGRSPWPVQWFRTAVHQLHQRKTAAVFQPPHVRAWAGRVQTRGYRMGIYWLRHGLAVLHRPHRKGILPTKPVRLVFPWLVFYFIFIYLFIFFVIESFDCFDCVFVIVWCVSDADDQVSIFHYISNHQSAVIRARVV